MLQATFVADFTKWDKALADAQKGLKTFEVAGKGVQKQLENMSKSLSGVNIKRESDIAVAGIKAIGGASALTQKEAQRLNAILTESIAKYKAMGQQVPAELRKIQAETAKVTKETGLLGSAVGKAGALLAGAFTVGAVVNMSRKVLQLGSDLADLSAKTGIGVEALQEFKFAGGLVGVSVEQITNAVNQMQNRISEGDKSAVGALKRLNISFDYFKKLKPEDQFQAVADAVGEIKDPAEKVRTAMDLMGKTGAQVLPALTAGFKDAREEALRMGVVLDEKTIQALDRMGERIEAIQGIYLAGFARLLVELEPLLITFAKGLANSATWLGKMQDEFEIMLVGVGQTTAEFADMEVGLYKLAEALNPAAKLMGTFSDSIADARRRATEARTWVKAMADGIQRDATKALIALAKIGEVRRAPIALGAGGASGAPSDEEIKRFQKWRDEVTGAATEKALAQLTKDWMALSAAERQSVAARQAVTKQYEVLRALLPTVGGALEDLRNDTISLLIPNKVLQQQFLSLGSTAMPDAVRMFRAGQAAVDNLNRDTTSLSRTVVKLKDGMGAMPAVLKSTSVAANDLALRQLEAAEAAQLWRDNLEDLAQAFALLAQIAPGALGKVASLMGKVTGSINLAVKGWDSFMSGMKALKGGNTLAGLTGIASGILGIASAAVALGKAIADLFHSRAEKTMARVAYEFGVTISEELAQGIEDEAERQFGGSRQASKIFHLDKILSEGGGLSEANIKPMFARFRDLFSMLQTGAFTSAQAVQVLDDNFRTFADFVTKGGSLASKELLDIIRLTRETGLASAEVSAFVVQESNKALGGLTTFLQNVQVKTQAAADGIGAALFGIFEAQTANGVPAAEVIKQLDPLIKNLDAQLKKAGLSGGAAFTAIKDLAAVAGHEIAGPLITGILGLGTALEGLHNSGILTEEMFDGLTASIADTYAQILATGVDGSKALQLIAPSLQDIWELTEDFGHTVDDATQKLLDEAKAAGLVGDEHRTATEQMLKLTERMTTAVEFLAKAFGYVTDNVEDLGDAIENLPDVPRGVPEGGGGGGDYERYARGGLVPKRMAWGGPSGSDTVPAWLSPGEFVMSRAAVSRIGANNLQAMNSGSGGGVTLNFPGMVINASSKSDGEAAAEAFLTYIERNSKGAGSRIRAVVR